jgi:hypothetical protein
MAATVAALVLAPVAVAKGAAQPVPFCGRDGCAKSRQAWDLVGVQPASPLVYTGPPPLAPYYVIRIPFRWFKPHRVYLVPGARVARIGFNWVPVGSGLASALTRDAAAIRPYPLPQLIRVLVGGRAASEPAAYRHVFDPLPASSLPLPGSRGIPIVLRSAVMSPWTNDETEVTYFPGAQVLHRQGEWVRAPAFLARRIDRDLGVLLAARGSGGGSGFPWVPVGGGLAAAAIALLAAFFSFRPRPRARAS